MKRYKAITLIFILLICGQANAETPYFRNFNINQGLPSNKIYCIIEDRHGFIWIGTDQGVSRYDGVEFQNFSSSDGLPDNEILGIFEDKTGRIWFNSFSSGPSYYFNGKIFNSVNEPFLRRVQEHKTEERNYNFIVQKNNSIAFLIKENNKRWIVGKDIQDIEVKYKTELRAYLDLNILIETPEEFHVISPLELIRWHRNDSVNVSDDQIWGTSLNYTKAPGKYIYGLKKQEKNNLVIRFDVAHKQKSIFNIDSKYTSVYDFENKKYLANNRSYALVNDSFNRVLELTELPFIYDFLYMDKKGNKWFGTSDNGIYVINKNSPSKVEMEREFENGILAIEAGNNSLFFRTENKGLIEIDSRNRTILRFFDPNHMRIRGFYQNKKFNIVGTDGGITKLDLNFKHPVKLSKQSVKDIEPGYNDEVLFGVARYSYMLRNDSLLNINNYRTYAVCRLNSGTILTGGLDGIYRNIETKSGFITSKFKIDSLVDNSRIVDIKTDKMNNLWIATDQKGVFFYSEKFGVKRFSQNKDKRFNLLSDVCFQINIDNSNNIWIATQSGISKISYQKCNSLTDFNVLNYSLSEGIPGKIVNSIEFFNNKVYITCPDGIFYYQTFPHPEPFISETLINSVWVNSKVYHSDSVTLPYNENSILISYASSFINMGNSYRFIYRVKELENKWTETQNLQIPLLGLNSGTYTFEIASVNTQGDHGKTKTLYIYIQTPWFRQWWFILLIVLALSLGAAYYFKLYKDKIELGTKLTLMKLRVLRAQMNPHFVFNALSNIQQLININELESAKDYIGTLSSIMRKSLDYSVKEFISLDKEIEYTESYLKIEKLRFTDKFDYSIDCRIDDEETENCFVPPLLLQPLVENSIKHAFKNAKNKGILTITIDKPEAGKIRYTIKDNGLGFDINKIRTKEFGLGIAKERVELLYQGMKDKAYFHIESTMNTKDSGTIITIELPIPKEEI